MNIPLRAYTEVEGVVVTLVNTDAKSATKYISDKLTVRASRKLFHGKLPRSNSNSVDIVLTIGAPNFEARQFIKTCKKAGEPFPVKKIQLKFPPKGK